ncbi:hypothetical protein D3C73_1270590 [compost metagenome]
MTVHREHASGRVGDEAEKGGARGDEARARLFGQRHQRNILDRVAVFRFVGCFVNHRYFSYLSINSRALWKHPRKHRCRLEVDDRAKDERQCNAPGKCLAENIPFASDDADRSGADCQALR